MITMIRNLLNRAGNYESMPIIKKKKRVNLKSDEE